MARQNSLLGSGVHVESAQLARRHTSMLRFAHAAALGSSAADTVDAAARFFIAQLCDYRRWPFAHARIFAQPAPEPAEALDVWHVCQVNEIVPLERSRIFQELGASDDRFRRVIEERRACSVSLRMRPPRPTASVPKSCWVAPLLAGDQLIGVYEFLTYTAVERDPFFCALLTSAGARLGGIIEKKRAEQRLRDLSVRLFQSQDEERRRIARELHDTTGQNIVAMLYDLDAIEQCGTLDEKSSAAVARCKSMAQDSLQEVRTCSYALHPPMLDELGFAAALGIFIENFSRRSGAKIDLMLPPSLPHFSPELETVLFRITQEGLTNAQRHAPGSHCKVRLHVDESKIHLVIENAAGGKPLHRVVPDAAQHSGVGLSSARERIEFFGGTLTLRSEPKRTVLGASIPRPKAMPRTA